MIDKTEYNHIIKQVIIYNSAKYAYFENELNHNILIEGKNNLGKTSFLNALQLLLLPENNLKNIKNKFDFKQGGGKSYTAEDTYNFYFPSENSYLIFEIENRFQTFTVILYGNKRNFEYRRLVLGVPYEEIKHYFINSATDELQDIDRKELFFLFKQKHSELMYKELKERHEIKEFLFSDTLKRGESVNFCIVPLRDTKESTIENYGVLIKSIYSATNMDDERRKDLIADIIETDEKSLNKKTDFNLSDLENEYKAIKKRQEKIDKLISLKPKFEELTTIFDTHHLNFDELQKQYKMVSVIIEKEVKDTSVDYKKSENDLRELKIKTDEFQKEYDILKEKLTRLTIQKENTEDSQSKQQTKLYQLVQTTNDLLDSNHDIEYIKNNVSFINDLFEKALEKLQQTILSCKEILNKLDDSEKIEAEKNSLNMQLTAIKKEISRLNVNLENQSLFLSNSEEFDQNEKLVLEKVFSNNFLQLNTSLISKKELKGIKDFLKLFTVKKEGIDFSKDTLPIDSFFVKSVTDEIKEQLSSLEFEKEKIIGKLAELNKLNDDVDNSKNDILITLKDSEMSINIINQRQRILMDLDVIENELDVFKKNISEYKATEDSLKEKENEYIEILRQLNEEEKDLQVIKTKSWSEIQYVKEKEEEFIQNPDYEFLGRLENIVEPDIEEYTDLKSEYTIFKSKVKSYLNNDIRLNNLLQEFSGRNSYIIFGGLDENRLQDLETISSKRYLISLLISEYNNLELEQENIANEINALGTETLNKLEYLRLVSNSISRFEKHLNDGLNEAKISDLDGVVVTIVQDKQLLKLINQMSDGLDTDNIEKYESFIVKLNEYLLKNTNNKNEIEIKNLIVDIKFEPIKNGIKVDEFQSNGTESMIMILFISLLFKDIYKQGYNLRLPVVIDEFSKIDIDNTRSLLKVINTEGFIVVGATPNASSDLMNLFTKTLLIGHRLSSKIFDKKRSLLVTYRDIFSHFKNEEVIDGEQ